MKLFIIVSALTALHFKVNGQNKIGGINFRTFISWKELLKTAEAEHKTVFIDVYATWCEPCKMMDDDVYVNDTVGRYINQNFIPVKLQSDSTIRDNDTIRRFRSDSRAIVNKYGITSLPSFLFVDSNGKLIYMDEGYKATSEFLHLANIANNPQTKQLYLIWKEYKNAEKEYQHMDELALYVKKVIRHKNSADSIANDFKNNYMNKDSTGKQLNTNILDFFTEFYYLINTGDKLFKLCYDHPAIVDSIFQTPGWAKSTASYVITKDELEERLYKDGKPIFKNPPWRKISSRLKGSYADIDIDKLMLDYKIFYYRRIDNWKKWYYYKGQRIQKYPPGNDGIYAELNVFGSWEAFKNCNDKKVLEEVLVWIDTAINASLDNIHNLHQYLDTKASLLYKIGRIDDAINCEKRALYLAEEDKSERLQKKISGVNSDPETYKNVLTKMVKREPTYVDQGAKWDANSLARIKRKTAI